MDRKKGGNLFSLAMRSSDGYLLHKEGLILLAHILPSISTRPALGVGEAATLAGWSYPEPTLLLLLLLDSWMSPSPQRTHQLLSCLGAAVHTT